jgi:hypothetical protein
MIVFSPVAKPIETITEKRDSETGPKQTRLFIGLVHTLLPVPYSILYVHLHIAIATLLKFSAVDYKLLRFDTIYA